MGAIAAIEISLNGGHATQSSVFFVFVAFLVSFLFIRASTRLMRSPKVPWWPGSIKTGGLHIHHLVFGIVLMLIGGTAGFALTDESPWVQLSAVAFGIGAGLTFDEFALWLHLEDVYWAEEGRQSVDASVIAIVFVGMVMAGVVPVTVDSGSAAVVIASLIAAAIELGLTIIAFVKRRFAHGYVGLFIWPIALWGALRLAKPDSPWANRFYGERNPTKQARSEARYADRRIDRAKDRFRDLIGGQPTAPPGVPAEGPASQLRAPDADDPQSTP
jgi:hypothetical protein